MQVLHPELEGLEAALSIRDTPPARLHVARILGRLEDYASAVRHLEEALGLLERDLPADDAEVARCLQYLGTALWKMGRHGPAQEHLERSAGIYRLRLGPTHPKVVQGHLLLAELLLSAGDAIGCQRHHDLARESLDGVTSNPGTQALRERLDRIGRSLGGR